MIERKKTRRVVIRNVPVGDGAPIPVQSMTNTDTANVDATLEQIERLRKAGCDIVRIAVPNRVTARAFARIRKQTDVPLVADIHFQYRLALEAIEAGADKVRINPGNIGNEKKTRAVVDAAKSAGIPIRIGVNAGSLEKDLLDRFGGPRPAALVESAMRYHAMMERMSFDRYLFSIKASDVVTTIEACRQLAQRCDIPQHIGITESGTVTAGTIRSSVGIGTLLAEGIGDTIRVSLAGDPCAEIPVARAILRSLDLATGPTVIACPTCGRTQIDLASLATRVEALVADIEHPLKIAVMGCIVNGPGEARDADVGVAGGRGEGHIFVRGTSVEKVPEQEILPALRRWIERIITEREQE